MALAVDLRAVPARLAAVRRGARLAALGTMALGALTLLGWTTGVTLLSSLLPGHIMMKANTAIGMLLAGSALWACVGPDSRGRRWSAPASLAVLLLGTFSLGEMLAGVDSGAGTLLFDDPDAERGGRVPGQMSLLTAIAFVLAGVSGLLACRGVGTALVQWLAAALLLIALFVLSAYGYLMGETAGRTVVTPLGLNTGLCLFALGLGWLAAMPDRGLARVLVAEGLGGELARRALLPALTPTATRPATRRCG